MLELFDAWQGGGFGPGALPCAGGLLDQPACTMRALNVMRAADAALAPRAREARDG